MFIKICANTKRPRITTSIRNSNNINMPTLADAQTTTTTTTATTETIRTMSTATIPKATERSSTSSVPLTLFTSPTTMLMSALSTPSITHQTTIEFKPRKSIADQTVFVRCQKLKKSKQQQKQHNLLSLLRLRTVLIMILMMMKNLTSIIMTTILTYKKPTSHRRSVSGLNETITDGCNNDDDATAFTAATVGTAAASSTSVEAVANIYNSNRGYVLLSYLVVLLVVCIVNTSSVEAAESLLGGDLQSCSNEGEEVQIGIKNSKCFKCACQNGFVKCDQKMCPSIDDCYLLEKKTSDTCCSKCKDCIYRGVPYISGSEWSDPDDPCRTYKCVGSINGQYVQEGQTVVASIDDRCLVCQCTGSQLKCAKKTCPVLQCPITRQKLHPNECCPRCTEQREFMPLPGKCFFNNKIFYDKIGFNPDRCTNCTCLNGTSICKRKTCPILECSPEYQEMDGCCPRCLTSEVRSECIYLGKTYQTNETWNISPCRSCRCIGGGIQCSEMMCPPVKCRLNEELKIPNGECCPQCIETAGTCTVFGDPHFRTFDGKFYSFQGSCKYLLAADCRDHTFSIRLTNDGRTTNRSSWAKTVTLKLKGLRVNLGQKLRVKVNGSRIPLPYSQGVVTNLERINNSIMLKTELGLNVEWDGNNFLQIIVPSSYKRRLCGLCGNYNGLVRDDLTSRDGVNHSDQEVWRFANSWKVGGPKSCSRRLENIAAQPTCKQRKSNAFCKPLRESALFGNCDSSLNPINFIDSCKMDVCECPTGMCHCDSFAAYAHECQRLGVNVPDWRTVTNCPFGVWKRNLTTTISLLKGNPYYGDLGFLEQPTNYRPSHGFHRKQNHKRKQKHQQHHDNQLLQRDFINKHVPKNLLISKSPDRTPPPLH
uniref:BMP-binding endothelial regulator protein n=1 Tax=Glossina morsitans morsitans TaxID=37546 RepID=A0A1B0GCB4_GLOMM